MVLYGQIYSCSERATHFFNNYGDHVLDEVWNVVLDLLNFAVDFNLLNDGGYRISIHKVGAYIIWVEDGRPRSFDDV